MGSKNGKPVLRKQDIDNLVSTSGMTKQQVKDAFSHFVSENPEGKINHKVFKEMLQAALVDVDADKMEAHVFRIYDINNDGSIDFVEFMVVYNIMAGGTPEEIMAKIFRLFDEDSNGFITRAEMKRLVADMYGLIKKKDPHCLAMDLINSTAFAEMDTDSDGRVTLEEFIKACKAEQDFSRLLTNTALDIFFDEASGQPQSKSQYVPSIGENKMVELVEVYGKSVEEINEAFRGFTENFPNGRMTLAVFSKIIPTIAAPEDVDQVRKMERHIFRIFDTNDDGYISFVEYMVLFTILERGEPTVILEKLFRLFDHNSDGFIVKSEMNRLVIDMYGLLKKKNPQVEADAFIAKSAFKEMDSDLDGKVSMEEFVTACLNEEEFSSLLTSTARDIFYED